MTARRKYPSTLFCPWVDYSLDSVKRDKKLLNDNHFQGKEVIVTEKLDGENTAIASNYTHARSARGKHGNQRSWRLLKVHEFLHCRNIRWSVIETRIPHSCGGGA